MALHYLGKQTVANLLIAMWKKDLNTTEDPTNGQWLEKGANGDKVGLIGGLTDLASPPTLGQPMRHPPGTVYGLTYVDDNRGGKNSNANTASLSITNTTATTATWTYTNSVAVEVDFNLSFNIPDVFEIGGGGSITYQHDTTNTNSTTKTTSQTASVSIPVQAPAGKIYMVVLVGTKQEVDYPYTVNVVVSGNTETWFNDRINGHYNWSFDIGTAFGKAGNPQYINAGNGKGAVVGLKGTLHSENNSNFVGQIYDVTASAHGQANWHPPATNTPAFAALIKSSSRVK